MRFLLPYGHGWCCGHDQGIDYGGERSSEQDVWKPPSRCYKIHQEVALICAKMAYRSMGGAPLWGDCAPRHEVVGAMAGGRPWICSARNNRLGCQSSRNCAPLRKRALLRPDRPFPNRGLRSRCATALHCWGGCREARCDCPEGVGGAAQYLCVGSVGAVRRRPLRGAEGLKHARCPSEGKSAGEKVRWRTREDIPPMDCLFL